MSRSSFEENYLLFFEGKSLSLFNINQVSISVGKYLYFCGSAAALLTAIFIVNITLIISYKNSFIQILKITLRAGFQYFVSGRFYTEDALSSRRLEIVLNSGQTRNIFTTLRLQSGDEIKTLECPSPWPGMHGDARLSRVSLARARSLFRLLLPSACYVEQTFCSSSGYASQV